MVPPLSDDNGIPHSLFAPHSLLAPLCGSDEELRAAFGQGGAADTMPPGPALAATVELAAGDLPELSDDELTGVIHAARRLENRAFYLQAAAVAEFTRRRAEQLQEARDRGVPRGCREGEYPDLELAAELLVSRRRALVLMDEATELATRLPRTFAGMADGRIDPARGLAIADATLCLSGEDAARADEVLSAGAHELRADTLARRAAALAMKLDPEAVQREREDARNTRQRVEARREDSGNTSLSGREMDTAEVMAAKASLDAIAVRLRNAGVEGTLDALRSRAFLDLLQFRDPFGRQAQAQAQASPDSDNSQGSDRGEGRQDGDHGEDGVCQSAARDAGVGAEPGADGEPDEGGPRYPAGPGTPAGGLAPLPALVNLIVPAATLLGWGTAPGQAGSWGLTDPAETRDIVTAASLHPRTRWCATVVNQEGEAVAHACACGRHPWTGPPPDSGPLPDPGSLPDSGPRPDPDPPPASGLPPATPGTAGTPGDVATLLRGLGLTPGSFAPIAKGECGHQHAEDRYTPSRKLKHLIRARAQTCTAPGCATQSFHADQDHVIPYPDGPTDECNLHAPCRAHHRAKQAPGWHAEQPQPGIIRWTLPNGRTHTTRPTAYDLELLSGPCPPSTLRPGVTPGTSPAVLPALDVTLCT